jgi:hypothetical protein
MMKFRSLIAVMTLAGSALPLAAQGPTLPLVDSPINGQCTAGTTQDVCQKTIDMFNFLAPQLGTMIAGGNATIGVGGTLGGLGHIYISGRVNAVASDLPAIDQVTPSTDGARSDEYPTVGQVAGIPQVDVAVGVFQGLPIGVTNVGGIDLLGSVSYLPSISTSGLDIDTPDGSFKFGGGVRVGIIQETPILPAVSVTYLRRGLPTVNLAANSQAGDTLRANKVSVKIDSYRLVVGKTFMTLGVAAGVGRDRYNTSATGSGYVAARAGSEIPSTSVGPIALEQKIDRTTYFVDASLDLPFVKLVGELGRTSSVTIPTYNTFVATSAGAAMGFASIGLRFGL